MSLVLLLCTYFEPFTRYSKFEKTTKEKAIICLEGISNGFFLLDLFFLTYHLRYDFSRTF